MMLIAFVILLCAVLFAWGGQRTRALYSFIAALGLASFLFYLDITSQLTIQL